MRYLRYVVLLTLLLLPSSLTRAQSGTGFYRAEGTEIVDPSGNPVVPRGIGLGGWLVPEGYMLDISAPDGGSPSSIRAQIEELITLGELRDAALDAGVQVMIEGPGHVPIQQVETNIKIQKELFI